MSFKGKKVIVTGGSGFMGINLIKSLLDGGAFVLGVSRRKQPDCLPKTKTRLQWLEKDLTQHPLYITAFPQWLDSFKDADYIFHLAAAAGGIHYLKQHQADVLRQNLTIISNSFADIEKFKSLKGQLFVSSVCAYPQDYQDTTNQDDIVLSEKLQNKYNPDSAYGWSKIIGEMFINHFTKDYKIPGVSIRLFNTYGPHENFNADRGHVIPALIKKAIEYPKNAFNVLGNGEQVRSFLYIDDAIDAMKLAIQRIGTGGIINIGHPRAYPIYQLVNYIVDISGKKIIPEYSTDDSVGAKGRLPDMTLCEDLLEWAPAVNLDDGLRKTYAWVEDQLREENNGV